MTPPKTAPLMVTSLNPFGALGRQMTCFNAFKSLGFQTRTANALREIDRLLSAGVAREDILEVPETDTGLLRHGKAVPRIAPLLARVGERAQGPVILTNADIFPAAASAAVLDVWLAQAPIVALTREETPTLAAHSPLRERPYRNGLDAFVMTPAALNALNARLADFDVRQEMAFGIPGWDFFLGALTLALGGVVMDSGLLLHETHSATYSDVSAFAPYVPAMATLGATRERDAADAAYAFHQRIMRECTLMAKVSTFCRLRHYRAPHIGPPSPSAAALAAHVTAHPFWAPHLDAVTLGALADEIVAGAPFERTQNVFDAHAGVAAATTNILAALAFHLAAKNPAHRPARPPSPADKAHTRALARLLSARHIDDTQRRQAVATVFATERADHGLFNAPLHDYLALSAQNEAERVHLAAIVRLSNEALKGEADAA